MGIICGAGVVATVAMKQSKDEDDNATTKNDIIEPVTRLLNRATTVAPGTESYRLDVSLLRERAKECHIDTYLSDEYQYAPIGHIFDIHNTSYAYVPDITENMFFDALTIPVDDNGITTSTRYLTFMLVAGEWGFIGSAYDWDKDYTNLAHHIVWDSTKPLSDVNMENIESDLQNTGKCRLWKSSV
jgi:hypothetical protein